MGDGQQVPSSPYGSGSVRALGAFQQSPGGASEEVCCNKFCGFKNRRFLSAGHDRFLVRLGSAGDSNESTENGQGMNAVDILSVIRKWQQRLRPLATSTVATCHTVATVYNLHDPLYGSSQSQKHSTVKVRLKSVLFRVRISNSPLLPFNSCFITVHNLNVPLYAR